MNPLTRLINRTHAYLTQGNAHRATPDASCVSATTAVTDTHDALPQTVASSAVSDAPLMLQAPTGTQQTARRVRLYADGTLQVPPYCKPVLTRASLKAWQNADGLTNKEKAQRNQLALAILATAIPSASAGSHPDTLEINGNLHLFCYPELTQLPAGLHVSGDLDCSGCTNLTQLPEGLSIGGNLYCSGCANLTQLPEGLRVGGDLDCCGCPNLTQLPEGLRVGGNLFCYGCTNLTQLPEGLRVGGHLNCYSCTSLTQLPEGLRVGGNLHCYGCTSLTQLPEGLRVGGNLDCGGCTSLSSLPNDIAGWGRRTDGRIRRIDLTGTGITPNLQQNIERAQLPGIRIDFGMAAAAPTDIRFADFDEATAFWHHQAPGRAAPKLAAWQDILPEDRALVRQFLGRLCDTADYQHPATRARLAGRVCDLLQAMNDSKTLRRLCSDCISDALQTCGDRVIWAMNQVETAVRVHQAQQATDDGAKLKELVLSFMRLDIVQTHARQKVATLTWVDEIEVFLAYESGLREALELPVSAENMLFARCAQVTPADLEAARQTAVSAMQDSERVAAYLDASAPWQHHLRQQAAKQWSWENLVPKPWPQGLSPDELQCGITLENVADLAQPILCPSGNAWRAYEAKDLLTHWIESGTDAFQQKFELNALRRPPI